MAAVAQRPVDLPSSQQTSHTLPVTDELPTDSTLAQCDKVQVYDRDNNATSFRDLYHDTNGKVLIVFIRHFYCGLCQQYIRTLSTAFPPTSTSTSSTTSSYPKIIIIGHGSATVLPSYIATTSCPFPIYTDPSRTLYTLLGMRANIGMGPTRPQYQTQSTMSTIVSSFVGELKAGSKIFSGGDYSLNGGEWVFEDGEVRWGHRMRHTRDHAEVEVLREVLAAGL